MALNLTRRSLLAALPVTGAVMALPARMHATTPDAGLERIISEFRRRDAETLHFNTAVYDPAHAAYVQQVEAIPHAVTTRQYVQAGTKRLSSLRTSDSHSVAMARRVAADFPNLPGDYEDVCRELVALDDERQRQVKQIGAETKVRELARRSDTLGEWKCQALYAVEDYPVTTLPAMMRKIEVLREALGDDDDIWGDWTLADLRRIAGEASHGNA